MPEHARYARGLECERQLATHLRGAQRRHGGAAVLLRAQLVALVLVTPIGVVGVPGSRRVGRRDLFFGAALVILGAYLTSRAGQRPTDDL